MDLAGKYRPKKLSDVIGQPSVVTTLTNAIETERIHHAYLFHGNFGCGKTTVSKVLAAMINCKEGPTTSPCGVCDQCIAIFNSKHGDVEELDAASSGKVADIRELKKSAYYAPIAGARKKVYIIDECLPYETKITLDNGEKIEIGQLVESNETDPKDCLVQSFDVKHNKIVSQHILRYIKIPNNKQMYELEIEHGAGNIKMVRITGNHSIYANGHYVKTRYLKINDEVIIENNETGSIIGIKKIKCNYPFVYNIEVQSEEFDNKNYFAEGLLVSNCHSLTDEGEEALLKIIEEPPKHVMFIFCTTELQKMRPTIVSRCQSHSFSKVYWTQLASHLTNISKKENLEIEESAIKMCSMMANGSVRNALQCLDKLINYCGNKKITGELAQTVLGIVSNDVYYKLMSCIINNQNKPEITEGYRIINSLMASGSNIDSFLQGLDEHLRCLLIMKTAPKSSDLLSIPDEEKKRIAMLATRFEVPKINDVMCQLSEIYRCKEYGINIERLLDQWFVNSVLLCHSKT